MYDLKKIEEKFHEYLRIALDENQFRINEIKITEGLFKQQEAFYVPFGILSYFLVLEVGKPVLYACISTRMDVRLIIFIDENGYEEYDEWLAENENMSKKYGLHLKKVKEFKVEDLKFINDFER